MIRYTRHTGPISHPQLDPPEDEKEKPEPVPQPWEDDEEPDDEGRDP